MAAGALLLAGAVALASYNLWDMRRAAASAEQVMDTLRPILEMASAAERESDSGSVEDHVLAPDMDMPEQSVDGTEYIGVLEIPELGLCLPVAGSWDYERLKTSPCRYAGSAYTDDLVLAAHNYREHFGRLSTLSLDSELRFTDVAGNVFRYGVVEFETVGADAVEEVTSGSGDLTLFTCTVGGKSRVLLRADRIE